MTWLGGLLVSGDEFLTGQRAKVVLFERVMDKLFGSCDVIVQTSPLPFDIIGLPEIAFPIGMRTATGSEPALPIGTILGGQPYAEDRLLEVAAAYQDVTGRAPLSPGAATQCRNHST